MRKLAYSPWRFNIAATGDGYRRQWKTGIFRKFDEAWENRVEPATISQNSTARTDSSHAIHTTSTSLISRATPEASSR